MIKIHKAIDLWMIASLVGLLTMGLLALYSSSQSSEINFFNNQLQWIVLGTVAVIAIFYLPNRLIYDLAYVGYIVSLIFLVMIFFVGTKGYGATRWLRVGGIGFQPSEFAKIATLLAVARYLSDSRNDINSLKTFVTASSIILVPFLLVAKQPDLGTALVFTVMVLPLFYWAGLDTKKLILLITPVIVLFASFNYFTFLIVMIFVLLFLIYYLRPGVLFGTVYFLVNISAGFLMPWFWNNLKDYQKKRITTFFDPETDRLGSGYQIIQSKVAIGSGGIFGKGFMHGSQTQLRYLPEQHNDFIFAVIGEEFGFIGVLFCLVLFTILLFRIVSLANIARNRFRSLVAIGIGTILGFHTFVNIGMTAGLFPVTGLPLPFISYGGTALLINMAMIGILMNIYHHRYKY